MLGLKRLKCRMHRSTIRRYSYVGAFPPSSLRCQGFSFSLGRSSGTPPLLSFVLLPFSQKRCQTTTASSSSLSSLPSSCSSTTTSNNSNNSSAHCTGGMTSFSSSTLPFANIILPSEEPRSTALDETVRLEGHGIDRALYYLYNFISLSSSSFNTRITPCIITGEQKNKIQSEKTKEKEKEMHPALVQRGAHLLREILKSASLGIGKPVGITGKELLLRLRSAWAVAAVSSTAAPRVTEKVETLSPPSTTTTTLTPLPPGQLTLPLLHCIFEEASIHYCFTKVGSNDAIQEVKTSSEVLKDTAPLFYFFEWTNVLAQVAASLPYEGVTEPQFLHILSQVITSFPSSSTTTFAPSPILPPYALSFKEDEKIVDGDEKKREEKNGCNPTAVFASGVKKTCSSTRSDKEESSPPHFSLVPPAERFGFWIHHHFGHLFFISRSVRSRSCLLYYSRIRPNVLTPFLVAPPPPPAAALGEIFSPEKTSPIEHKKTIEEGGFKNNSFPSSSSSGDHHSTTLRDGVEGGSKSSTKLFAEDGKRWLREVYGALAVLNRDKLPVWTSFKDVVLPFIRTMQEASEQGLPCGGEMSTEEWYYLFRTSPVFSSHFHLRPSISDEEAEEGDGVGYVSTPHISSPCPSSSLEGTESQGKADLDPTSAVDGFKLSSSPANGEPKAEDGSSSAIPSSFPSSVWVLIDAVSLNGEIAEEASACSKSARMTALISSAINKAVKVANSSSSRPRSSLATPPRDVHITVFTHTVDVLTVLEVSAEEIGSTEERSEEEERGGILQGSSMDGAIENALGKASAEALFSCLKNKSGTVEVQLVPVDDLFLDTKHVLGAFLEAPSGRKIAAKWISKNKEEKERGSLKGRDESIMSTPQEVTFFCDSFSCLFILCGDTVLADMKKVVAECNVCQHEKLASMEGRGSTTSSQGTQPPVQPQERLQPVVFFTYSHAEGTYLDSI